MEARSKLQSIHQSLTNTDIKYKSLFGIVSDIHLLSRPPIPLNTEEMHSLSGQLIREAKREVLLEFYKFSEESDGGKEIYSALEYLKNRAENEKTKIDVCMLVNSRGFFAETIYKCNNTINLDKLSNSEYFNIKLTLHSTAAFGSLNTKMIIIDSRIAMIRGGDPDPDNDKSRQQFETATLLHGSIASIMRNDYNDVWKSYCGEPLPEFSADKETHRGLTSTHTEVSTQFPCIFLSKRENGNPLSPYSQCPYKIALLQAILEATTSVHIMTPNLNDSGICEALANACKRGVSVSIITGKHHNENNESWWGGTNFASLACFVSLVPIEYHHHLNIRWATNPKGYIVNDKDNFSIHAKYACIDNELVFVGSSSLDQQAMLYSREADFIFLDAPTAKSFDNKFFSEKFEKGKDYFEEAYFRIVNQIELQAIRIRGKADTEIKKNKAANLFTALLSVKEKECTWREKLYHLIEASLPILEFPTGNKPGMPVSYNKVVQCLTQYGLANHFKNQTPSAQKVKEDMINQFFLIPSTSPKPVRKRSVSQLSHEKNESSRDELRKIM